MADLRRCIGSARFGIEPHDAPVDDFPSQPSQKDGLGRMCRAHWNAYTAGLARDAKARKAAADGETGVSPTDAPSIEDASPQEQPPRSPRAKPSTPIAPSQENAD